MSSLNDVWKMGSIEGKRNILTTDVKVNVLLIFVGGRNSVLNLACLG